MKKIVDLVSQFEDHSLPVEEWTHLNKIRVCCYYLLIESDLYEVIVMLRCGFIRYRAAKTTENRCLKGYNETVTVFWVHMCKRFLEKNGLLPTFGIERLHESTFKKYAFAQDEFFERVFSKQNNGKYKKNFKLDSSYIYKFFSKEYLETSQARAMFIAPRKAIK
jgi:hypothetical protein